ncbi:diguanylate cyclase [Edwardsiella tarda]|uniref:diguanylate cyclase domain-containing protein n=1 Tax=Edwardsiella tarda TaxID=636 RepID=UPI00351C0860
MSNGIVARIGGDEFLVIIKEVASEDNVKNPLREVRALFNAEFGDYMSIGSDFSLGYCRFSRSIKHTLVEVDGFMYKNKSEKQC